MKRAILALVQLAARPAVMVMPPEALQFRPLLRAQSRHDPLLARHYAANTEIEIQLTASTVQFPDAYGGSLLSDFTFPVS